MVPKIIAFMNSYSHGKSGGDTVFLEIAKRIKKYRLLVVTSMLGKKLGESNGIKAQYLLTTKETDFNNVIPIYFLRIFKGLLLKIKINPDDILLATSDFLPDVLPALRLKLFYPKIKWVQHIFHLISPERKIPYTAQRISLWLIKNWADLIIVDNQLLKKDLEKFGFDRRRIIVNYPGIDHRPDSLMYRGIKNYDGIFMAQIRPAKGIYDLIKIWQIVCQKLPEAKLGIIGTGDKKIIESIPQTKNITLLGFLEDREAMTLIRSGKLFIFPSHEEGFGIAPLQAQSLGLPVVAWDLPVFGEIFPRGMIRVPMFNHDRFADEIIRLLSDKRHYNETAKEAISNSRRFNWDTTAKRAIVILERSDRI